MSGIPLVLCNHCRVSEFCSKLVQVRAVVEKCCINREADSLGILDVNVCGQQ